MIICGTGHRPNKVGGYSPVAFDRLVSLAHMYLCAGEKADKVISGGALGWDQALAWAALRLGIPFTMALPFKDFDSKWPSLSRGKFNLLCSDADEVVFVSEPGYAPWKMQVRNEWMVDRCDKVVALWDGSPGGTGNCIKYAEKVGKPIVNLWEMYNVKTR